jgi:hypothetical protein
MGLRACLTCSAMISTNAKRCPQCGEPSPHLPEGQKRVMLIVALVVFVLFAGFIAYRMHDVEQEHQRRINDFPR